MLYSPSLWLCKRRGNMSRITDVVDSSPAAADIFFGAHIIIMQRHKLFKFMG